MSFIDSALQIASCLAGAVIVNHMVRAIDAMDVNTHHGIRIAFIIAATGGFTQMLGLYLPENIAHVGDCLLGIGMALLFLFDRRYPQSPKQQILRRKTDHVGAT